MFDPLASLGDTRISENWCRQRGFESAGVEVSGCNVYPDEVDRVSLAHPAVLESATVGAPDEKRGEMVKSFIVCAPGKTVTAEELRAHGKAQLAPYKVPSQIEFRSELPKSSMMKVLRRELKAKA